MEDDFSFLQPLDLITNDVLKFITNDVYELRKIIKEKKENLKQDRQRDFEKDTNERNREHEREHAHTKEKEKPQREKEREQDRGSVEKHKEQEGKGKEKPLEEHIDSKQGDKVIIRHEESGQNEGFCMCMESSGFTSCLRVTGFVVIEELSKPFSGNISLDSKVAAAKATAEETYDIIERVVKRVSG
ncbi:hypothetical protein RHMOL_Rhmol04G0159900 [Rhododendron molle]|uniref:Uncharacterized protein n=2 Tax=Rhododendron molle TaxID=49168 RepID=A0ACC0P1C7_RHOML|nr:hypothetical protein RHMOL_Rhmol04G0159900 [Rhododendron molle]KAI8559286.1 hypothetical protein RHMOL_Rhmol04G0159900 [Rhododendron molle]